MSTAAFAPRARVRRFTSLSPGPASERRARNVAQSFEAGPRNAAGRVSGSRRRCSVPLLDDRVQKQVRAALAGLTNPVKLVMFTQGEGGALECSYCGDTRQLAEELSGLSDKVQLEVLDFEGDASRARSLGVDKIPAIVLLGGPDAAKDHGIRFFGIPAGYEFGTLLEELKMVSAGTPQLSAATMQAIARLKEPVHIQVFVTPT
jgi:glutaredoxin-like protein